MSNPTRSTVIPIKVVSDGVCPFCYIGKRKLDLALEQHNKQHLDQPPLSVALTWYPYQLDPDLPSGIGVPKKQYYLQRFGPQFLNNMDQVNKIGKSLGIRFTDDGNVGNTLDYHRLLKFVRTSFGLQAQNQLVNVLFVEYFELGHPLSDHSVLLHAVQSAGLDSATSNELKHEVLKEIEDMKRHGISGVPDFDIDNGKFNIHGAQDPDAWLRVFAKIKENYLK